ncbi:MAG: DUF1289 domain-containing protein [Pseudomonadota bacterium]
MSRLRSRSQFRLEAVSRGSRDLYPASPCVSICTLDDAENCLGCSRTLAEITGWSSFSKEKQWQIIDDLKRRTGLSEVD